MLLTHSQSGQRDAGKTRAGEPRSRRRQRALDRPLAQVLEAQQHVGVAFGAVHLQPTRS
jgi:hypothetical protein